MQTIGSILKTSTEALTNTSTTPRLDVEIFLSEILKINRAQILAHGEDQITSNEAKQINAMVKRRLNAEPVAYIVGHQPFWTLDLKVTVDTLIPRPETEHLVEWILENTPSQQALTVADLGVGCGAIALAIADARPLWQVDAVDISAKALEVAKLNAGAHQIENIHFFNGHWCKALPDKKYDIIVSNPPYIAPNDPHLLDLKFEPQSALVAEDNGLYEIKTIIKEARQYLAENGSLIIEHGFLQSDQVLQIFQSFKYSDIQAHVDLSSNDRFVSAKFLKEAIND